MMNRREFVGWIGVGWVASCLPVAIAACSSQTGTSDGTQTAQSPAQNSAQNSTASPRADGFQAVGSVADLDKTGELMVKDFTSGAVAVVRDPANPKKVLAVSPTCPHQGCAVAWKADKKTFVCPCHGSEFSPNGQVVASPATRPLKTFMAKIEGDSVLVKA